MSILEHLKNVTGRAERNEHKQRIKNEEADSRAFTQQDYEALVREIAHQTEIDKQVAELEAKLTALKAEASASKQLTELHFERAKEAHETKALGMQKLKKLESFSALTSSFFQNILIGWGMKNVNSVQRKREEIRNQIDEAKRFQDEAHAARMGEISNKERINALLLAMRQGGGLVQRQTQQRRGRGGANP